VTTLGPTQRLRFIGGGDVGITASNNTTLNCIDITVAASGTASSNIMTINVNCIINSALDVQMRFYGPQYGSPLPSFTITIDWGDNSQIDTAVGEGTFFNHTYSVMSIYNITISCTNWSYVGTLWLEYWGNKGNLISPFPWSFLTSIPNLEQIQLFYQPLSGSIPTNIFTTLTNLMVIVFTGCLFSGTIPDMSKCTKLETFSIQGAAPNYTNSFTNTIAGSFATQPNLSSLSVRDNLLTELAVDQILLDLVSSLSLPGRVSCYVRLDGTNSPPSNPLGLSYRQTLLNAGWSWIFIS
jgi:hypothetical protein